MIIKTVIVIGGGPAGIMAAVMAAAGGAKTVLLEKNEKLGKKLLITGKGRCNVTNAGDMDDFIQNFPGSGRFLYSALSTFSNKDLMRFFEEQGIPLKVERGNRVFPVSDRSFDILRALEASLKRYKVKTFLGKSAVKLLLDEGKVTGVKTSSGETINGDIVIVATGGISYPVTGSTGDGYKFAAAAGHSIIEPRPALVPLETRESWVPELQGLALKNVLVSGWANNTKFEEEFGEMLFTHFGVSGPIILTLSRKIIEALNKKKDVKLRINLKPALTVEQLDARLQRDFQKFVNKQFKNALDELLPQKLIPVIIKLSGIDEEKRVNQITKKERSEIINLLTGLPVTVKAPRSVSEAIVTAGGVSVKEINPKTMESKLVKGLYFCGEVLDVDGNTGGFNLQAAFSTGYLAGVAANKE